MSNGHYTLAHDFLQTREQVNGLPLRYLDEFAQECKAVVRDTDICLSCYALELLDLRIEEAAIEDRARSARFSSIPQLNGDRDHTLELRITIPVYGKPDQDMKEAQRLLAHIKSGVHSAVTGMLITENGEEWVEAMDYFIDF